MHNLQFGEDHPLVLQQIMLTTHGFSQFGTNVDLFGSISDKNYHSLSPKLEFSNDFANRNNSLLELLEHHLLLNGRFEEASNRNRDLR